MDDKKEGKEIIEYREEVLSLKEEKAKLTQQVNAWRKKSEGLELMDEDTRAYYLKMQTDLMIADKFVASKAFPTSMNSYQAFTIMRAGEEMGLKPVEALQSLYVVNGQIAPYGKGMVAVLTKAGYKIEFSDESKDGVTVRVFKPIMIADTAAGDRIVETEFDETYVVVAGEEDALKKSKAMGFARKNKMRYHGIRQIINFHLAHMFGSVDIWEPEDRVNVVKEIKDESRARVVDWIKKAGDVSFLERCSNSLVDHPDLVDMYDQKYRELAEKEADA